MEDAEAKKPDNDGAIGADNREDADGCDDNNDRDNDDRDNDDHNSEEDPARAAAIEELKKKASDKFSEDEVTKFIEMGKVIAQKTVLSAVICVIMEGPAKGKDAKAAKKLKKKVEAKMTYGYCGFTQVAFREFEFKLNICLSLVPRGYKTSIDIPHAGYAKDLYSQYDFLKSTAQAYWLQFAEENKKLYRAICEYRDDIDFSQLTIDQENITTMYFDPQCEKRVGIFCYYVDAEGRPFYKREGKN